METTNLQGATRKHASLPYKEKNDNSCILEGGGRREARRTGGEGNEEKTNPRDGEWDEAPRSAWGHLCPAGGQGRSLPPRGSPQTDAHQPRLLFLGSERFIMFLTRPRRDPEEGRSGGKKSG